MNIKFSKTLFFLTTFSCLTMYMHAEEEGKLRLHEAVKNDSQSESFYPITSILDDNLGEIKTQNEKGETPLHLLQNTETFARITRYFKSNKEALREALNIPNNQGKTPLDVIKNENLRKKFLEFGATPACEDNSWFEPFWELFGYTKKECRPTIVPHEDDQASS